MSNYTKGLARIRYYRRWPSRAPIWFLLAEAAWELVPVTFCILGILGALAAWS